MKEFKGTPGPWRVISSGVHVVASDVHGGSVVVLRTAKLGAIGDEPEQCIRRWESDAQLASAAPDLLAALQSALAALDRETACGSHLDTERHMARKAIAKALGEDHE